MPRIARYVHMNDSPRGKRSLEAAAGFLDQVSGAGERFNRLVERLPAIIYACDVGRDGRWRYVSGQIEEILGYTPEEWMADPTLWQRQLHPEDRERVLSQEDSIATGRREAAPVDYRMFTRDGRLVWILDESVLEPGEDGTPVWHGILYDITKRKLAEQELRRAAAQQAAVARLGRQALQSGDSARLMEEAVAVMSDIEGVCAACIWELPKDGRRMQLLAGPTMAAAQRRATVGADSHASAALESGLHVMVDDWTSERRFAMPAVLRVEGVRSSLAVPIDGPDRPFGVLDIHSDEASRFTPQDVHFVQSTANVLADALVRNSADRALRHRVLHDSLTGLPNRTSFVERLEGELKRSAIDGTPVGVLFLDLDHFKLINDSIGHHAGDDLLREVALRLRSHLRPGDIVARFGGDEFGILIDDLRDEDEAALIADRVTAAFADPYSIEGADHFVSASIGIAVARPSRQDPVEAEALIRDADAAMYRAKERGRARSEFFDAEMRERALQRLEVERELRGALDRDELRLYYQPLIALGSGEITCLEALVRWEHPERGTLDPSEFVSIAEDSGLIEPLGRWVLETACRQLLEWHEQRPDERPLDVSVNLSTKQVAHRGFADSIAEVLERTGLDPIHLRLEVTEAVLVDESAGAASTLEALSGLGVQLVLDDFGTGYSSLAYLNRFPFDALKIDRSFIEGLGIEEERTAIVEAVIGMAHALSLDAIAEGVESEEQVAELRRLGCDHVQGHLFSRPLPAEAVGALVKDGGLDLLGNAAR